MSKNIIGFVLIDAPHSALNNAGQDAGAQTENTVLVKTIRRGRSIYPYVSAQAWRYWWRTVLQERFDWKMSPIIRGSKVAFTSADPFTYPDDDLFGYMRANKASEGGTLTRLSPLKCSPLVSVYEHVPTDDFGVMARHEGDPVPFEHQFYSTILKGIFSLNLNAIGKFSSVAKTGQKNLDEAYVKKEEIKKAIKDAKALKKDDLWVMPKDKRVNRAKDVVNSLPFLYSETKAACHLTDVTPKFIALAVIEGGNHIFMNITNDSYDKPLINLAAFKQVIHDYKDTILSDIFIGRQEGFIDNIADDLSKLDSEEEKIRLYSPKLAVEEFVQIIDRYID